MSFNIGHALVQGAETFLTTGNPIAAGVSAVEGGFQNGTPAQPDPIQLNAALGEQPDVLSRVNALANFGNKSDFGIIAGDQ
jgi:hypothetical protein